MMTLLDDLSSGALIGVFLWAVWFALGTAQQAAF